MEAEYLPYKSTGKEMDEARTIAGVSCVGLYYYGARYLDPKYSMWMSTDPALGDYVSGTEKGEGGIYNHFNFNLYHYANNNPLKYTDPTGMSIDDWQDNGDGTWTVKSEGAKLWDVWGAAYYEATGLTEEEARNIHVGDTFGKEKTPTHSDAQTQNIGLWDLCAGKSNDGLTRALYTKGIINNDLNNGQLNLTVDLGGAEYGFETPKLSLFGGKFKASIDGAIGTFTGQGSIGIKDFAIGADGDISMLKAAGTIHLGLFGINSKISLEGFLGGLAGGQRSGFNLFSKHAYGIGGSISVAPENIEEFFK